ncbi:MAG: MFS transporter, partial [Streptococcaceae bacterium]|nr:MFS transporter [Streptococcaceae bacterium]
LLGIVFIFIFQSLSNGYLLQILRHVGGNDSDLGTTLFLTAMSELPVMMAFSLIASKVRIETLLKFSALMFMIRSILMLFAGSVLMVNLVQLLQALSFALLIPAAVYYVNHRMEEDDQVKGQAFVMSACTVGSVLAFLSGGWLIEQFSVPIMLLVGAIAGAAGFLCFMYSVRKKS